VVEEEEEEELIGFNRSSVPYHTVPYLLLLLP
jgi:hypothetical protein